MRYTLGFCFSETSFPHDLGGNAPENQPHFVWDGSHLLQKIHPYGRYTYIYTDPSSYEPLAQVRDWTTEDGEGVQQAHYFHCDKIGIPREMTVQRDCITICSGITSLMRVGL